MKVIVAGGRHFTDMRCLAEAIKRSGFEVTEVVCGGAKGADLLGKHWAHANGVPVKEFPAQWSLFGRSAGPRRNSQMAEYADALIALPGGRGTMNMIETAPVHGCKIYWVDDRRWSDWMHEKGWTPYD